jgi:CheY-like chemotaxis protein
VNLLLILVVDDEPDVEVLFRQQFRHDLRAGRFTMEFALSGDMALQRIADAAGVSIILILSDINMPGMTGLELLPKAKEVRPDVPIIMITAGASATVGSDNSLQLPIRFLECNRLTHQSCIMALRGAKPSRWVATFEHRLRSC